MYHLTGVPLFKVSIFLTNCASLMKDSMCSRKPECVNKTAERNSVQLLTIYSCSHPLSLDLAMT